MQRVEAKRNSVRGDTSSEDDDEDNEECRADETSSQSSLSLLRGGHASSSGFGSSNPPSRRSNRSSRSSHRRSREMVEAAMPSLPPRQDLIVNPSQLVPPPPPPPRDPRRKLYLLKNEDGRPISYSFENVSLLPHEQISQSNMRHNFVPQVPQDLGVPVESAGGPISIEQQQQQRELHRLTPVILQQQAALMRRKQPGINSQFSASEQQLSMSGVSSPSAWARVQDHDPVQQQEHWQPAATSTTSHSAQPMDMETPRSRRPLHLHRSLPPSSDYVDNY